MLRPIPRRAAPPRRDRRACPNPPRPQPESSAGQGRAGLSDLRAARVEGLQDQPATASRMPLRPAPAEPANAAPPATPPADRQRPPPPARPPIQRRRRRLPAHPGRDRGDQPRRRARPAADRAEPRRHHRDPGSAGPGLQPARGGDRRLDRRAGGPGGPGQLLRQYRRRPDAGLSRRRARRAGHVARHLPRLLPSRPVARAGAAGGGAQRGRGAQSHGLLAAGLQHPRHPARRPAAARSTSMRSARRRSAAASRSAAISAPR